MQKEAIEKILSLLPDAVGSFEASEYPLPVRTTVMGDRPLDVEALRRMITDRAEGDVKDLCEPLVLAAEVIESCQSDRQDYFLSDQQVRDMVFMGSKWLAGWVLVLGGVNRQALIAKLKERGFMVFTDAPDIEGTTYIGNRDTSPVYFLQLMVRYGLIWGGIAPGDDHRMSHYLEEDMPGFIVIGEDLPPLKYHITLGLMKLGAPAVVPASFPFPYGSRVTADRDDDIIEKGSRFPNMRQRYYKDEIIALPDYCNRAYAQEKFTAAKNYGGTDHSFFCVRPASRIGERIRIEGKPDKDVGILIEVAEDHFTDDIADTIEKTAREAPSFLSGVSASVKNGVYHLELREDTELNPQQIAEAILATIRFSFPRLEKISARIVFDKETLETMLPQIETYKEKRRRFIADMTEENTEAFCICTECRPFSLVHTCILSPERVPMCGARSYATVKAAALFGTSVVPYQRHSEENIPLRATFNKGKVIDAQRGEYEGANAVYQEVTQGKLQRVFMHSLREYPHTSCGCFQTIAFWINAVEGIGLMQRRSEAISPDGYSWDNLANRAGGKQSPGVMGISIAYIRSPHFLKGDGGRGNVVWVDSKLYSKIKDTIPENQKVATEGDVSSIEALRAFIGR